MALPAALARLVCAAAVSVLTDNYCRPTLQDFAMKALASSPSIEEGPGWKFLIQNFAD